MTKNISIKLISILAMLLFAEGASAATFNLIPTTVTTEAGKSFTLQVFLNPQSSTNYTTKMELKYPADILQANSFNFSSGWMPLSQTGYDIIDNTNGVLIKTGGYPYPGVTTLTSFGAVTFTAKKSGTANISVGSNSLILDGSNNNALSSFSTVAVNVNPIAVATTPKTVTTPKVVTTPKTVTTPQTTTAPKTVATSTVEENQINSSTDQIVKTQPEVQVTETPTTTSPNRAALADFLNFNNWNPFFIIIVLIVALLVIFYVGYLIMKR